MNNVLDFKSIIPDSLEKLHHSYCLEGKRDDILPYLLKFLNDDLKFIIKGNPDFYQADFEVLGIDEGRSINEAQSRKATFSKKRIFIISANSITKEAQNSLLKMFEEPSRDTVFFLIIPSVSILLPTLCSRMMIVNLNRAKSRQTESLNAKKFIKSNISERLSAVKEIVDKIANEELSRSAVIDFLNSIEMEILKESADIEEKKKKIFVLGEIDKCRNYASDRSPSVKILLEHIALVL